MKDFSSIKFRWEFRDYQKRIIEQSSVFMKDGKINIAAAPGSGKTILGLELIRKLGRPAIVFSPSITIRQQWGERFEEAFMPENDNVADYVSYDITNPSLITSVTYQCLYAAYNRLISEDAGEEAATDDEPYYEKNSGDYTGFDLITAIKKAGIRVICLDEAHHLRSEWQKSLEGFINNIKDEITIISLTATPPYDCTPGEWQKYISLCGEIDDEIFVPQLVAQKTLCPHQDYIYFNYPSKEESGILDDYRQSGKNAVNEIISSGLLKKLYEAAGFSENFETRKSEILENTSGVIALLSAVSSAGINIPKKLIKLVSPGGDLPEFTPEFAETAFQFLLDNPDITSTRLTGELKKILSGRGLIDKKKVSLVMNNKIKSMLISSIGKLNSINKIVRTEYTNLGSELRMLILTDYIRKDMKSLIGTDEKIVNLGASTVFESVRREFPDGISLAVLSGGLVILGTRQLSRIKTIAEEKSVTFKSSVIENTNYSEVCFSGSNKNKVAVVTQAFQEGIINVMIGTKSLLGEGWDSPCINTLIIASFVGSFMLSNQMRGRAIRTDKNTPGKTSNIWHLVTVEPPHIFADSVPEKLAAGITDDGKTLFGCDMEGLTRRFECFLAPAYSQNVIESGISRIDIIKPPYNEKSIALINKKMEELSRDRKAMARKWDESLNGVINPEILKQDMIPRSIMPVQFVMYNSIMASLHLFAAAALVLLAYSARGGLRGLGSIAALLVLPGFIRCLSMVIKFGSPAKTVKTLCGCIFKTLSEAGIIATQGAYPFITVTPDSEFVGAALANATAHEKNIFAQAVKEMMSEIDNPRYLIVRQKRNKKLDYVHSYSCPSIISTNKKLVEMLSVHLSKSQCRYTAVYTRNENGREHILSARTHSYVNQNMINITGKKTAKTKWQ